MFCLSKNEKCNGRDKYTVWKFHNFSITQILREINFEYSCSVKSAILTHFEALNFDIYESLHLQQSEIFQSDKIQSLQNGSNGSF